MGGGMFLGTATIQINNDNNTRGWGVGGCLSSDPALMERAKSWLPTFTPSDLNPLTFGHQAGKADSCFAGERLRAARQQAYQ